MNSANLDEILTVAHKGRKGCCRTQEKMGSQGDVHYNQLEASGSMVLFNVSVMVFAQVSIIHD